MAAVILSAIGFVLLEGHFHNTDGRILARTGATAYLFAGIVLVAAEGLSLSPGFENRDFALFFIYVVLAFLAQSAIGGALLQSGLLARWIGWVTILWNLAWLVVLPVITPEDICFPILHHLMPLLDRKSTRLNSSHANISYAVFCLKKKKQLYILIYTIINNQ